ncbi:MAG: adenylate/guanylate cyclase domain-containing protein [Armatimonadetes bacterium]|nr:adenylate/guanylate cyclase domain-containing protein [Armatimonadota bacterium]
MKLPLRATLTLRMTALLVGTLVVLGAVAFFSAQRTVNDLADRIIRQTSRLIDGRVENLLSRAESNGRLMAGFVSPTTATQPVISSASQFDALAARQFEVVSSNPHFSSIRFVLDRTGEHVMVIRQPNGSLVLQSTMLVEGGKKLERNRVPFGESFRNLVADAYTTTDFRSTPWYLQAKKEASQVWTGTYVIRNIAGPDTPGITYALPVYDRKNVLLGVVAIDFTISDLSRYLETITVGSTGYAALIEFSPLTEPRIVAHPQANRLVVPEGLTQRLATVHELGDRALETLIGSIQDDYRTIRQDDVRRKLVRVHGRAFQTGIQRVSGDRSPDWFLAIVIPDGDFMSGVWQAGVSFVLLSVVAVSIASVASHVMAGRLARPLQALAAETERVRALDLEPRRLPESKVKEISDLSGAMEQMKTGLRSFGKLVPADYAKWLIASGQEAKLGGERRRITTYFADIIGFTALSEKKEPEELVEILAEYLDVLSSEVLRNGGTVDKFNGDDVMAFWGAPSARSDHAFLACKTAVESQNTLAELHKVWAQDGKPLLRASFGISTGDVIVGNVGSRQRMNYTVIGDAVNLASRLQGLNKYYSTEMLVSSETVREAGDAVVTRTVDYVSVAGRGEPIPVYELLALTEGAESDVIALAEIHDRALRLYRDQHFAAAIDEFAKVLALRRHDGPARILRERCERFIESPPGDQWDGAVHMHLK